MSSPQRDIAAVLDESGPDYDSFSYERPTAGHQGEVFFVTLDYQEEQIEVVVKFQSGDPEFAIEPKLHDYVAERTELPVPEILVFEQQPDSTLDIDPYFITKRIEGTNLAASMGDIDRETREQVIEHAGKILGDMHANVRFEGFGRLAWDEDRFVVDEFSWDWQQFFHEMVHDYIDRLEETPFSDLQQRARDHIDACVEHIESTGPPRLVHDDFRPANMLFDPERDDPITAVLDWQFALAAEAEYHIARTEFLFIDPAFRDAETRERLRQRLYDGYQVYHDLEVDEGFEQRRTIYYYATLLWRMLGFEAAFADQTELMRGRAEVRFKQQFDQLADQLPGT